MVWDAGIREVMDFSKRLVMALGIFWNASECSPKSGLELSIGGQVRSRSHHPSTITVEPSRPLYEWSAACDLYGEYEVAFVVSDIEFRTAISKRN